MSLFEILVILIVGILVAKPEDFPKIFKKIKEIRSFINNTKKELLSHLDPVSEIKDSIFKEDSIELEEEMEQMNFYLSKIANLGYEYEGEYSLIDIKNHYRAIVKNKMKETI